MAVALNLADLIVKIKAADDRQVKAQFTISGILYTIKKGRLYEDGGYATYNAMVIKELPFAVSTADQYASLFGSFLRLKYEKQFFLDLIQRFGWRIVAEAIRTSQKQLSANAIQKYLTRIQDVRDCQFNFNVGTKPAALRLEARLAGFGMEITEGGSRMGLTSSFELMMEDYDRLKAIEARQGRAKKGVVRDKQMEMDVE